MGLVIILLLSTGAIVSSTKTEPCPETAKLSCGSNTYNPLTETCCMEVIGSLTNKTHPDCCGKHVYDRSTHLCCSHNGQVDSTDVSNMDQPECCGTNAYDVTTSKCCPADVKESMPIVYQPSIQYCKHSAKVDRLTNPGPYDMKKATCGCGVSYDPKHQKCCPGNIVLNIPANTTNPDCCGNTIYDQNTHKCCAGKLHDISGTVQPTCCGTSGTFYDQASELCCDGAIKYFHGLGSPACCGKEAFNSETHECSNDKVSVKSKKVPVTQPPNHEKVIFLKQLSCESRSSVGGRSQCHNNEFIQSFLSTFENPVFCCKMNNIPMQQSHCETLTIASGTLACPADKFVVNLCGPASGSKPKACDGNTFSITCCTLTIVSTTVPISCAQGSTVFENQRSSRVTCERSAFPIGTCYSAGPGKTPCDVGAGDSALGMDCCHVKF